MPATGNILLDTSVVIPYLKDDASIRQQIQALPVFYLPMTVVGEPENDIWIAALAREQAMPLVTRDAQF